MPRHDDEEHPFSADNAQLDGRLRQAQMKMLAMLEVVDTICQKHQLDYWLEGGTLLGAIRHQGFIPWDDDMDISMPRASFEAFLRIASEEFPDHMWLQTAQTDTGYFNLAVPLKIRDKKSRFVEKHEQGNEPYQQGIFIDVFVYDTLPTRFIKRKIYKLLSKKALRLVKHQYTTVTMGNHAALYQYLGQLIPKRWLDSLIQTIIHHSKHQDSLFTGFGYDSVNSNLLKLDDIYPLKRAPFEGGLFSIPQRYEVILTQLYGDYLSLPPEHERVMKHCRELVPFFNCQ